MTRFGGRWRWGLVGAAALLGATWALAPRVWRARTEPLGPPLPAAVFAALGVGPRVAVTLETDEGPIRCELDGERSPQAVSLFLGLSTGHARWWDPASRTIRDDPLYHDLTFHRAIPGVMVQSGCAVGDSSGHPGYRIAVESSPADAQRLRTPGALALARYTPPPFREDPHPPPPGQVLGSQFFVTLTDMSHLAGKVTVLGSCQDLDRVAALARRVKRGGPRPRLASVTVQGE